MRLRKNQRQGSVVVLVALSLTIILGFAAIAIEGGLMQHNRRLVQSTADASALAAVAELYSTYQTSNGKDLQGTAKTRALAMASANGFSNDLENSKVTVNIPPATGLFAGKAGYAEVIVEMYQQRSFSGIWGSQKIPISGRAVAVGRWGTFGSGIIVLDPASKGALNSNGNGVIQVEGADIIVNSKSSDAAVATGRASLSAPNFFITGVPGTRTSGGGQFYGNIVNNQDPTPDPLAYLPEPNPNTMITQSTNTAKYSGTKSVYLKPGVYEGGIDVAGQVNVYMSPGIYYMKNGGFSFSGQGKLSAEGVMIYMSPSKNSDDISISGLGEVKLTPPTSGLYTGISLWQARSSTNTISVTGNGTSTISGTFYAQHGTLAVTGNGSQDVLGAQYISYRLNLGGNGNFYVKWDPQGTARTRTISLVE